MRLSLLLLPLAIAFCTAFLNIVDGGGPVVTPNGTPALVQGSQLDYGLDKCMSIGPYVLVMQADCNLVLYRHMHDRKKKGGKLVAMWASGTFGRGDSQCHLNVQADGNMVIYDGQSQVAVWATGTTQDSNPDYVAILILTPLGDMQLGSYIYVSDENGYTRARFQKAIWVSNTGRTHSGETAYESVATIVLEEEEEEAFLRALETNNAQRLASNFTLHL